VHSQTWPSMSAWPNGPSPAGLYDPTCTGLPCDLCVSSQKPLFNLSGSQAPPQGYNERVLVPRAAHSHSASVGSRTFSPVSSDTQRATAIASYQLTPTTGCSSSAKRGLP